MTRKQVGGVVAHFAISFGGTLAGLRALPPWPWYWIVMIGFVVSGLLVFFGAKWEFEWQRKVARVLTWWDRDGCAEAAWAFPIGSLLGTAAAVLWR